MIHVQHGVVSGGTSRLVCRRADASLSPKYFHYSSGITTTIIIIIIIIIIIMLIPYAQIRERSGSVVECLTRDGRVAGSRLTGVTVLLCCGP